MTYRKFGYYLKGIEDSNNNVKVEMLEQYAFERDVYCDNYEDKERKNLLKMLDQIKPGDTVYFYSLNYLIEDMNILTLLLGLLAYKNIRVCVLDLPTTTENLEEYYDGDKPLSTLVTSIIFDVLALKAKQNLNVNRKRQNLGFIDARHRGVKLGRKPKELPSTFGEDYRKWKNGQCTAKSLYERYGWSNPCFYKHVKMYEQEHMTS